MKPLTALLLAPVLTTASAAAAPGLLALGASPAASEAAAPSFLPREAAPAFRGLFVVVMPWEADRHSIEARRRLQFALRLDEPKQPAFQVTVRF